MTYHFVILNDSEESVCIYFMFADSSFYSE